MRSALTKPIVLALIMLVAAGVTVGATPSMKMADSAKLDLEKLVPEQVGAWRIDPSVAPLVPSPDVQAKLDQIYNQVLARTYVDPTGRRIMLSIAYGGDQSDGLRAHRPEVCYAAQGFSIERTLLGALSTPYGEVPVKRLVAVQGPRREPITYWMVVGDQIALDGLSQKLAQIRFGLSGRVPDGMLVRVSSIDPDPQRAFSLQEDFVRGLLASMGLPGRARLLGALGEGSATRG